MAGRGGGRGRGRGQMTFNLEDVGIGRGDSLPPSTNKPSALFPPMPAQPVPLVGGEEVEYMLALKQELRAATKSLPFYIRRAAPKRDVDRYSDKYQSGEPKDSTIEWSPDWSRLPKELCIKVKAPLKNRPKPQLKRSRKSVVGKEEILTKLDTLEKKEGEVNSEEEEDEEKKKKKEEEGEQPEEEGYDEEDFEEDTDYIMSYFDNGEEFGADSDDGDEATY